MPTSTTITAVRWPWPVGAGVRVVALLLAAVTSRAGPPSSLCLGVVPTATATATTTATATASGDIGAVFRPVSPLSALEAHARVGGAPIATAAVAIGARHNPLKELTGAVADYGTSPELYAFDRAFSFY